MTVRPIDPVIQAQIDQDWLAKTGPFSLAVLASYQVSEHYGVHCTSAMKLLDRLSSQKVKTWTTLWIMDPAYRDRSCEAAALYQAQTPATLHDAATLEALNRPLSRFRVEGGTAATEALVLGDFHARTGLFVRPVLVAQDLVDYYGAQRFRTVRLAGTMLGAISFRAQVCQFRGESTRLHVVHDEPELMALKPRELLNRYRLGRGLPEV